MNEAANSTIPFIISVQPRFCVNFIENDTFWQLSVLYYAIERPSTASIRFAEDPEAKTQPEWVRLDSVDSGAGQDHGGGSE